MSSTVCVVTELSPRRGSQSVFLVPAVIHSSLSEGSNKASGTLCAGEPSTTVDDRRFLGNDILFRDIFSSVLLSVPLELLLAISYMLVVLYSALSEFKSSTLSLLSEYEFEISNIVLPSVASVNRLLSALLLVFNDSSCVLKIDSRSGIVTVTLGTVAPIVTLRRRCVPDEDDRGGVTVLMGVGVMARDIRIGESFPELSLSVVFVEFPRTDSCQVGCLL